MTSQSAATLRSRYLEQAASDLEQNRRQQQELTEKLTRLKHEEGLLAGILDLAERYEGFSDASRLPEQAQDEPVVAKPRRTPSAGGSKRSASAKTSKATAKKSAAKKSPQPLLGDVLADLLSHYEEPRAAKELRDELLQKHPDRNPTPQVVRNTLESLVAKGRIERHKQDRSVMYTLVEPGAAA
ncbi:hypothetical protein [Streptomyces sp. NPDC003635]